MDIDANANDYVVLCCIMLGSFTQYSDVNDVILAIKWTQPSAQ